METVLILVCIAYCIVVTGVFAVIVCNLNKELHKIEKDAAALCFRIDRVCDCMNTMEEEITDLQNSKESCNKELEVKVERLSKLVSKICKGGMK